MPFIGSYSPDEVLGQLSDGEVTFSFTQGIIKVVLGSCSTGMPNMIDQNFGASTVGEEGSHEMNLEFWRHHLEGVEGDVLIVTECCGQYNPRQLKKLKEEFPRIRFITPHTRDYADNFSWRKTLDDLLKAGLIQTN
jgi:hypothetical protein